MQNFFEELSYKKFITSVSVIKDPWFDNNTKEFIAPKYIWDKNPKYTYAEIFPDPFNSSTKIGSLVKSFKFQPSRSPANTQSLDNVKEVLENFSKFEKDLQNFKRSEISKKINNADTVLSKDFSNSLNKRQEETHKYLNLYKKVFWNDFNNNLRSRRKKRRSLKAKRYKKIIENLKREQYLTALQDIEKAIELDPRNIFLWLSKGKCNYFLNNYKEAIRDLDQAIKLNSDFWLSDRNWFLRDESRYYLNQSKEAIRDFDQSICRSNKRH